MTREGALLSPRKGALLPPREGGLLQPREGGLVLPLREDGIFRAACAPRGGTFAPRGLRAEERSV